MKVILLNKKLLCNCKIVDFELEYDDDPEYKIEIIANGYEYDIEIDGYTGKVLEFEKDDLRKQAKIQTKTLKNSLEMQGLKKLH